MTKPSDTISLAPMTMDDLRWLAETGAIMLEHREKLRAAANWRRSMPVEKGSYPAGTDGGTIDHFERVRDETLAQVRTLLEFERHGLLSPSAIAALRLVMWEYRASADGRRGT